MIQYNYYQPCSCWGYATYKAAYPLLPFMLSTLELENLFRCDADNGLLVSRVSQGRWIKNRPVGQDGRLGYRIIRYNGRVYLIHRLIWQMVHGVIPDRMCIDHIDGNARNNTISNLRLVTHAQNQRNLKLPRHNTSGRIGVYWVRDRKKWMAAIYENGRYKNLGRFARFEDAIAAREAAERRLDYHPNHGRIVHKPAGGAA